MSFEATHGKEGDPKPLPDDECRRCHKRGWVTMCVWESSCGGYEDHHYRCENCGGSWWVEGWDS